MTGATGSAVLPPDRPGSPGSLIVSFAGSYLRQLGGEIAVADLIHCLAVVGVGEPAARQALSRLKSRGFFAPARLGGRAGYRLTDAGLTDLRSGDRRIFHRPDAREADGWVLAVFSVPESERSQRHRLRSELSWLGFGTVASGVWAAPRPLAEPTRAVLTAADLDRYVTWFEARHLSPVDVGQWWDLPALRDSYDRFLTAHRADSAAEKLTDDAAFATYLRVIDAWRVLPRIDPGLPASLLPPDWPAAEAWATFAGVRDRWAQTGVAYVRGVVAGSSGPD
jgi:phenylacetic acid degradation operon negative regulatory protein